jgi:RimJ/RimL family protein N-acetyltransferase
MKTENETNDAKRNDEQPITTPFLIGERVTLRTLARADVPNLLRWVNDPATNRYLIRGDFPMGWGDELEWVDRVAKRKLGDLNLGIEVHGLGLIGTMGLCVGSWSDRTAGTGTMIGVAEARGKGYGTEAKMLLLDHAFNRLNLRKVYSEVCVLNVASHKCQLRCGYVEEGRLRGDLYRDGAYHDRIILAVTRETFEDARRSWLARCAEKGKKE